MKEILELLKQQRKEVLQWLVLELMRADKLSFAEVAELHVQYLEQLRKGESKALMKLRSQVISLWCDTKKNIGKNLVSLMQEAKDAGWANINQECIDNSKWNK